jgi:hypothetical protein
LAVDRNSLGESEYFLLMASPEAARSPWAQREVSWWLEHRSADTMLILVTDGELTWNPTAQDFNWARPRPCRRCCVAGSAEGSMGG